MEGIQDWLEVQPTRSMPESRAVMQGAAALVMRATTSATGEAWLGVVWMEGKLGMNRARCAGIVEFFETTGWLAWTGRYQDRVKVYEITQPDESEAQAPSDNMLSRQAGASDGALTSSSEAPGDTPGDTPGDNSGDNSYHSLPDSRTPGTPVRGPSSSPSETPRVAPAPPPQGDQMADAEDSEEKSTEGESAPVTGQWSSVEQRAMTDSASNGCPDISGGPPIRGRGGLHCDACGFADPSVIRVGTRQVHPGYARQMGWLFSTDSAPDQRASPATSENGRPDNVDEEVTANG
jgi:hypothetical protein